MIKALILKPNEDTAAWVIRANSSVLREDMDDISEHLEEIGFPDHRKLERGFWIFEGERDPPEIGDESDFQYVGNYRRPTAEDWVTLVPLADEWQDTDE